MDHSPPDNLQIRRAQKNDRNSLEQVIETTAPYILSLCISWCRPPIDPYDVSQESLIRVTNNIKSFKYKSAFFSWVYSITYRTFLDILRKETRRNKIAPIKELTNNETSAQHDDSSIDHILDCLNNLDDLSRDIIILIDVQGCSYQEVANLYQLPIGTIRSRIARTRLKLKLLLESSGTISTSNNVSPSEESR